MNRLFPAAILAELSSLPYDEYNDSTSTSLTHIAKEWSIYTRNCLLSILHRHLVIAYILLVVSSGILNTLNEILFRKTVS